MSAIDAFSLASKTFVVFDIESIGLHGEGFAVGYVVLDGTNELIVESGRFACAPALAAGNASGRAWVVTNVPPLPTNCADPTAVRAAFWAVWLRWKGQGAWLAADCAWPVEAKFLLSCVADLGDVAVWDGPYPLLDISSMLAMIGRDPRTAVKRLPDEVPAHDPLADARCSARQLRECLHTR